MKITWKLPVLLLLMLMMTYGADAQRRRPMRTNAEFGGMIGSAHYSGDVNASRVEGENTRYSLGAFFRYYLNPYVNAKAAFTYGVVAGDDLDTDDDWKTTGRAAQFQTYVAELSVQLEVNVLGFRPGKIARFNGFSPYVFVGIGVFNFNPRAEGPDGEMYSLRELGTEGQTLPGGDGEYAAFQLAIPYGIGLKYRLPRSNWNLGFEFGPRLLFTDYLDDVSNAYPDLDALEAQDPIAAQMSDPSSFRVRSNGETSKSPGQGRGDPDDNDAYTFIMFTASRSLNVKLGRRRYGSRPTFGGF